jgi:hypothetical protein
MAARSTRAAAVLIAAAVLGAAPGAAPGISAQVEDLSGRGGELTSRITAALRAAGSGREGSRFSVVFGLDGLVPSDATAGGGGGLVIQRAEGLTMSGFSGLMPVAGPWSGRDRTGPVIDLATMQPAAPLPPPVLETRPLLVFLSGRIRDGRAGVEDVALRLPEGRLALRERPLWWLGRVPTGEVEAWLASAMGAAPGEEGTSLRRDLVGVLSVLPAGSAALERLTTLATGDEDLDVRRAAVRYLGRRPEETRPILQRLFRDAAEEGVRLEAMDGLLSRMEEGQVAWLGEVARGDSSLRLRREAISELGRSGDEHARRILEEILGIGRP